MATMEEKIIQNILEEILFKIFPSVSLDDSLVTDDYVIGMDQEAPSGTNGEDTPDKPKCDRDVPDVHELPSYSKVEEEEFHVEVVKKPLIGSSEDEGQMKRKIEGNSIFRIRRISVKIRLHWNGISRRLERHCCSCPIKLGSQIVSQLRLFCWFYRWRKIE